MPLMTPTSEITLSGGKRIRPTQGEDSSDDDFVERAPKNSESFHCNFKLIHTLT